MWIGDLTISKFTMPEDRPKLVEVDTADAFFLQLGLLANAHGFESISEALIYSKAGGVRGRALYKHLHRSLFGHYRCFYAKDSVAAYAFVEIDTESKAPRVIARLRKLQTTLPAIDISIRDAMIHKPEQILWYALQHLHICPFSASWRVLSFRVPLRPLCPLYRTILVLNVQEEPWPVVVDLCDLQYEIRRRDMRKDRPADISLREFKENAIWARLFPHAHCSLPNDGGAWTFMLDLGMWVRDRDIPVTRLRILQRRRLARLLTTQGLREALYRPPLGLIYRRQARLTLVGK